MRRPVPRASYELQGPEFRVLCTAEQVVCSTVTAVARDEKRVQLSCLQAVIGRKATLFQPQADCKHTRTIDHMVAECTAACASSTRI